MCVYWSSVSFSISCSNQECFYVCFDVIFMVKCGWLYWYWFGLDWLVRWLFFIFFRWHPFLHLFGVGNMVTITFTCYVYGVDDTFWKTVRKFLHPSWMLYRYVKWRSDHRIPWLWYNCTFFTVCVKILLKWFKIINVLNSVFPSSLFILTPVAKGWDRFLYFNIYVLLRVYSP